MYLRFRSDNSPTHVGFKAKYSIGNDIFLFNKKVVTE